MKLFVFPPPCLSCGPGTLTCLDDTTRGACKGVRQ
jgi:hypothetical protein